MSKENIQYLSKILLMLFIAAGTCVTHAQSSTQPWYQVEVIVFSQQDLFNEEKPRTDIDLNYPATNWVKLSDTNANLNEATKAAIKVNSVAGTLPANIPFTSLPESAHQLGPDHYTLGRTPGYRILYHEAWRQPGLNFKNSPWILIRGGKKQDGHYELEGSLRLVKSRHLHIQANLWKSRFREDGGLADVFWPALPEWPMKSESRFDPIEAASGITVGENSLSGSNVYDIVTLKQSLKLTLNEPGYLDHPTMGVLVIVSKLPANGQ